jgi:phage host-nuclease inhibitor protein Gam
MENEEINLGDYLVQEGQPEGFDAMKFIINDDSEAIWAMRNLAHAQKRIDAVDYQAQNEIARITQWSDLATKSQRTTTTYFSNALQSYMVRLREEGRKSLILPDGEVTSRSTQSKAVVNDSEAFLKWAEANGHTEWVRTKLEPNISALKGAIDFIDDVVIDTATGEFIPGLVHVEGGVSVSIKIAGE